MESNILGLQLTSAKYPQAYTFLRALKLSVTPKESGRGQQIFAGHENPDQAPEKAVAARAKDREHKSSQMCAAHGWKKTEGQVEQE